MCLINPGKSGRKEGDGVKFSHDVKLDESGYPVGQASAVVHCTDGKTVVLRREPPGSIPTVILESIALSPSGISSGDLVFQALGEYNLRVLVR